MKMNKAEKSMSHRTICRILAILLSLTVGGTTVISNPMMAYATEKSDEKSDEKADGAADTSEESTEQDDSITETILIENAQDLKTLATNSVNDTYTLHKKFVLQNDIDLNGSGFKPIAIFAGELDGNGHTIKGLRLTNYGEDSGFIQFVEETGKIYNLTVAGELTQTEKKENVGGIAGTNRGLIQSCTFTGKIIAQQVAGGIVGHNDTSGKIMTCNNEAVLMGTKRTGGIAGFNEGIIQNSTNQGDINTGDDTVYDYGDEDITDFSIPDLSLDRDQIKKDLQDVKKINYIGGIAGVSSGVISGCENFADIGHEHMGYTIGGVAGYERGVLTNCNNFGRVKGRKDIGGIVGILEPLVEVSYTEDTANKLQDEMSTMLNLVDELSDKSETAGDTAIDNMDNIRESLKVYRKSLQNYKDYYKTKGDDFSNGLDGRSDNISNIIDELKLDIRDDKAKEALDKLSGDGKKLAVIMAKMSKYQATITADFLQIIIGKISDTGGLPQLPAEAPADVPITIIIPEVVEDGTITDDTENGAGTGTENGTGTGSGTESGTGSDTGSGTENGTGTGTGTGNGTENGTGSGTGNGTENGTGSGTGNGTENGSGTESGTGSDTGSGTESGTGSGTGNGTENGTGSDTGNGTENGTGSDTGSGTESGTGSDTGSGTENGTGNGTGAGSGSEGGTDSDSQDIGASTSFNTGAPSKSEEEYKAEIQQCVAEITKLNAEMEAVIKDMEAQGDKIDKVMKDFHDDKYEFLNHMEDLKGQMKELKSFVRYHRDRLKDDLDNMDTDLSAQGDYISGSFDKLSEDLKNSRSDIRGEMDQIQAQLHLINDTMSDGIDELNRKLNKDWDEEDLVEDLSDTDDTNPTTGKVMQCRNEGEVSADINGGGIAGSMMVVTDAESEFDVVKLGDRSLDSDKKETAIIRECKNLSDVVVRNDYAGGIVGRSDVGAVIASANYGNVETTDGDYTGGIAGKSKFMIRDSYALCDITGNNYCGGIAGYGKHLKNNTAMAGVRNAEGDSKGIIAGKAEDDGEISGNYFVNEGVGAVNNLSYEKEATALTYDQLTAMPEIPMEFYNFQIKFVVDNKVIKKLTCKYGDQIKPEDYPELPTVDGKAGYWENVDLRSINRNKTIHGIYDTWTTTISSDEKIPVLLLSGDFYKDTVLRYNKEQNPTAALSGYKIRDVYTYSIASQNTIPVGAVKVRVLADDYGKDVAIAVYQGDQYVPVATQRDGRYLVFVMNGSGKFAVITKDHIIRNVAVVAVIVIVILAAGIRYMKKKKRIGEKQCELEEIEDREDTKQNQ
ncbi:MAG: hypothetical protein PHE02_01285 [Lachnospiraceae bacterium]|nr:hypothetical protein [Lachnospiraceae bacterium]